MNRSVKVLLAFVALGIGVAFAQTVVRQGSGDQNVRPWVVTPVTVSPDGGSGSYMPIIQAPCATSSPNTITTVGTSSAPVPATALAARRYVEICNSLQNSGNPILKCRSDGTAPVAASGNAGTVLGVGDCYQFNALSGTVINCISDAVGTNATAFECQ